MKAYLEILDLWEVIEKDYDVFTLTDNLMVAQIKIHKERKIKKTKTNSCLFVSVCQNIISRIMTLKSAKTICDYPKEEYVVDERERYEISIATLKSTKDLSKITLTKVLHALQALEQKRLIQEVVEGVYLAK
uniref:Uncharacterized protein n=1 Tax=Cajanus cajan TaxID=3821 RepID=A0A151TQT9_CAJCA|nr:hypothetical protein KK1_008634 [Cajanus cajan]